MALFGEPSKNLVAARTQILWCLQPLLNMGVPSPPSHGQIPVFSRRYSLAPVVGATRPESMNKEGQPVQNITYLTIYVSSLKKNIYQVGQYYSPPLANCVGLHLEGMNL